MVTPEDRKFMWEFYAPEPRMRLNLGIRRRLAPLLGNNLARIKAANSILLTLIGSPFIYYGDEIGMGDNIWLDDRNGVRTPMQWEPGPDAGFSTAPAQALYAPVIQAEPFGPAQVNVQTQAADPDSLLNWTRALLRLRRQHPAFARGTLRLLPAAHPALLAYVRDYAGETLVLMHNLSSNRQVFTLDLSAYAGHRLVDLLHPEAPARPAMKAWTMDLDAYGFGWFKLE
jgi:maltose alpha-D-glucosyltransferase/alpha-amylase